MQNGWMDKSVCLACLGLLAVLTAVGLGQTAVDGAQGGTPSIMERVQRVDDPELAELIRTALANHKSISERDALEIVRRVTQGYAQTKLLDQQIEQVTRKIEATTGPADVKYELLLAKRELELKRTTEMANLREAMGVIPRFPFDKQPIPGLNARVSLQALDQRVVVLDCLKPFAEFWAKDRWKVVGLLSEKETLDYVRGRLKDKNSLPIRIDIHYKAETRSAAEILRDAVVSLAREANADMSTEVRLELSTWVGSGTSPFFLREGKITTFYPLPVRRPDGSPKFLTSGLVDPNDLEQSVLWRLTMPKNVPLKFRVEYDEASAELAKQVADSVKAVANRLGMAELVEVVGALVEPTPESAFLGRWQAITQGVIRTIDVQPAGVCQVTVGQATEALKAGADVKGTWLPTTKEMIIDIKDEIPAKTHYVYRGSINAEGNLVIDKGAIYPQGSLALSGPPQMILRRVP
jgi:hypothetical protein